MSNDITNIILDLKSNRSCHFCGETENVKYKTKIIIIDTMPSNEKTEVEVYICDKCYSIMNNIWKGVIIWKAYSHLYLF